jgi:hypothetical protein
VVERKAWLEEEMLCGALSALASPARRWPSLAEEITRFDTHRGRGHAGRPCKAVRENCLTSSGVSANV